MIHLDRIRTKRHIPPSFRDPKRVDRNVALIQAFQAASLELKSSMWSGSKSALRREANGKCAYCEAPAGASAHCDVEHFRPKSQYWWLALCYDNYLYACQICNQVYKTDNFPLSGARLPAPHVPAGAALEDIRTLAAQLAPDPLAAETDQAAFVAACRNEGAELLNPYDDDPELWFAWEADDVLKEVTLHPRNKSDARCAAVFAAADTYLGLNRVELRQFRFRLYQLVEAVALMYRSDALAAPQRAMAEAALSGAMRKEANFAGMVRYFVRDVWQLPLAIPT